MELAASLAGVCPRRSTLQLTNPAHALARPAIDRQVGANLVQHEGWVERSETGYGLS
jgi:hypothetical protein